MQFFQRKSFFGCGIGLHGGGLPFVTAADGPGFQKARGDVPRHAMQPAGEAGVTQPRFLGQGEKDRLGRALGIRGVAQKRIGKPPAAPCRRGAVDELQAKAGWPLGASKGGEKLGTRRRKMGRSWSSATISRVKVPGISQKSGARIAGNA